MKKKALVISHCEHWQFLIGETLEHLEFAVDKARTPKEAKSKLEGLSGAVIISEIEILDKKPGHPTIELLKQASRENYVAVVSAYSREEAIKMHPDLEMPLSKNFHYKTKDSSLLCDYTCDEEVIQPAIKLHREHNENPSGN
ncbi:MAG: hypothetical protein ABIG37_02615 [Nanoarchaeota archaeon]|nr:hypothetical protein [Nanoarchaeota archaeon]